MGPAFDDENEGFTYTLWLRKSRSLVPCCPGRHGIVGTKRTSLAPALLAKAAREPFLPLELLVIVHLLLPRTSSLDLPWSFFVSFILYTFATVHTSSFFVSFKLRPPPPPLLSNLQGPRGQPLSSTSCIYESMLRVVR
ncbi:uncharacterized protein BO97DRAFT_114494 [Aspergillus homomorphus CBS 101889]|uniref:Uncharacterized protein n=1 Tax=Aspergillus homomorphus (strain CBS 101889) TaxID=1450537 RepID=A0A395HST4_ASPHC|nr:hypothetical protein BO97DRAFT_114494 [Aspergillus homomorphus CBS 101889]RAL10840.1 hypothetical protein BO97DRAFT_114494 [Aspergillus homomorphus CBS 101889]